jgi:hypothetical protein
VSAIPTDSTGADFCSAGSTTLREARPLVNQDVEGIVDDAAALRSESSAEDESRAGRRGRESGRAHCSLFGAVCPVVLHIGILSREDLLSWSTKLRVCRSHN